MFLIFEGIDGSGKNTQMNLLRQELERRNERVILLNNPHDARIPKPGKMSHYSTILYYLLCLRQISDTIIYPIFDRDLAHVIMSRGPYSILAYQGFGQRYYGRAERVALHNIPEYMRNAPIIFLDTSVDNAFERCDEEDVPLFEQEDGAFMERVADGYRIMAKRNNWKTIDANQDEQTIHREVMDYWDMLRDTA